MAYIRTCVQNLGANRRPVRKTCLSSLIIDINTGSMMKLSRYFIPFIEWENEYFLTSNLLFQLHQVITQNSSECFEFEQTCFDQYFTFLFDLVIFLSPMLLKHIQSFVLAKIPQCRNQLS